MNDMDFMMSTPHNPDDAIAELLSGNQRYVANRPEAGKIVVPGTTLATEHTPFVAVIRCADARVSPEIWFDQPVGRIFTCGVAGNIPTTEIVASLEYAVAVLKVPLIVVMGHTCCGAIGAAVNHHEDLSVLPGSLPAFIGQIIESNLADLDFDAPEAIDTAIARNAVKGVEHLVRNSSVIADAVAAGSLKVIAGVQDLASGEFRRCDH